jgi:hypothetical protein
MGTNLRARGKRCTPLTCLLSAQCPANTHQFGPFGSWSIEPGDAPCIHLGRKVLTEILPETLSSTSDLSCFSFRSLHLGRIPLHPDARQKLANERFGDNAS